VRYATHAEMKATSFEYIEVFYNRKRQHSTLGYRSPIQHLRHEPMLVKAFILELAIEALDVSVLLRFGRLDEAQMQSLTVGRCGRISNRPL
jgi:hypothetical protein